MNDHETEIRLIQMEPSLFTIAGRYFSCYADRQDAVQECLCRAWRFRKSIKNPDAFEAWLVRIMKNVCVTMCRKSTPCVPLVEEALADSDPVGSWMKTDALYDALSTLPTKCSVVVRDHFIEGLTIRELSEASGVCMSTVQSRLYRSLRKLSSILA